MRFRNIVAVSMYFAFTVASTPLIYGCMYGPPFATVCEKFANADAVVIGTIGTVRTGSERQRVALKIERKFKGSVTGSLILDQPLSTCDWDFSSEAGKKFLLYLKKNRDSPSYHAIGTGYGGELKGKMENLSWLEGLPGSLKRSRISGTIQLYEETPFTFIRTVPHVRLRITTANREFFAVSNDHGVYELWDIPNGRYKLAPTFDESLLLQFPLEMGNIEWDDNDRVRNGNFEVIIGPEKCGGSDYVLKNRNG